MTLIMIVLGKGQTMAKLMIMKVTLMLLVKNKLLTKVEVKNLIVTNQSPIEQRINVDLLSSLSG